MRIFFHCHKAAGTTVTHAAAASGMRLPDGHRNGNPVDGDGRIIDWAKLPDDETQALLEEYKRSGIDMISFEFSMPKWSVLEAVEGLEFFTVLREPIARAFSNYRMDILNNYVKRDRVFGFASYMSSESLFRSDNYYTRFFSRVSPKAKLTRDHLAFARRRLEGFSAVAVLERNNLAQKFRPLGFDPDAFTPTNTRAGKKKKIERYRENPDQIDIDTFPVDPDFHAENMFDTALYAYFLHMDMVKS